MVTQYDARTQELIWATEDDISALARVQRLLAGWYPGAVLTLRAVKDIYAAEIDRLNRLRAKPATCSKTCGFNLAKLLEIVQ